MGIDYEVRVMSAHRTPERVAEYAQQARDRGIQVLIAAAGGSAALGGALAAWSTLPVIGIPLASSELKGIDALLSTAQMPPEFRWRPWPWVPGALATRPFSPPRYLVCSILKSGKHMTTTGANSASGKLRPAILTDFDDTAAVQNVAELLLNRFGDPTWTEVRQQFRDGKMNLKEYQEIAFRNIRADRPAMQHYVRERANLRPFFSDLPPVLPGAWHPSGGGQPRTGLLYFSPARTRRVRRRAHLCGRY